MIEQQPGRSVPWAVGLEFGPVLDAFCFGAAGPDLVLGRAQRWGCLAVVFEAELVFKDHNGEIHRLG